MRRSRAIYMRKLLDWYPDDPITVRYLTSHLIIPRFYRETLAEFVRATKANDTAVIEEMRTELLFILSYMPGLKKKFMRQVIEMMRSRTTLDIVKYVSPYVHPLTRRVV
jgi:hypothetical protein